MLQPYMWQQVCSSNVIGMWHITDYFRYPYETAMSVYTSYQLKAINSVTTCTGIHRFQINNTCSWANMPAKLCMYVPLHIKSALLHIQDKQASQYAVSPAVIFICTMHLATIFILYHQWPLMYSFFDRHISFSVIRPLTSETTYMCIIPIKCW